MFEVTRNDRSALYIIWERRDLFSGEDQPPSSIELTLPYEEVTVTDVFGVVTRKRGEEGMVHLGVTDTPLFLERDVRDE